MICEHCNQAIVEPDPELLAEYLRREQTSWVRSQIGMVNGQPAVMLKLPELYEVTFERSGDVKEMAALGRVLVSLGFARTYRNGHLHFTKPLEAL